MTHELTEMGALEHRCLTSYMYKALSDGNMDKAKKALYCLQEWISEGHYEDVEFGYGDRLKLNFENYEQLSKDDIKELCDYGKEIGDYIF